MGVQGALPPAGARDVPASPLFPKRVLILHYVIIPDMIIDSLEVVYHIQSLKWA